MDFSFNDERDATLINNKEGIKIEMSTSFIDVIETAIKNGVNQKIFLHVIISIQKDIRLQV